MALWVCTECTTKYSVGAPCCPHCGSDEHVEEGEPMPKIHADRDPTYAPGIPAEDVAQVPEASPEPVEVAPAEEAPTEPEASATAPPDYGALTVDQLRGLLAERDLSQAGKKADLIARLQEADAPTTGTSGVTIVAEATVTRPDGTTA